MTIVIDYPWYAIRTTQHALRIMDAVSLTFFEILLDFGEYFSIIPNKLNIDYIRQDNRTTFSFMIY